MGFGGLGSSEGLLGIAFLGLGTGLGLEFK